MNSQNHSKPLWRTTLYESCNDEYLIGARLDTDVLLASESHRSGLLKNKRRKVVLDPEASDYEDVFLDKGIPYAPDDILEATKPSSLKIPIPSRGDFKQLPQSDIIEAIHYHSSQTNLSTGSCDETALLALGMLVEQWADDLVDENLPACLVRPQIDLTNSFLPPTAPRRDIDYPNQSDYDDSDSDILSIDLREGDESSGSTGAAQSDLEDASLSSEESLDSSDDSLDHSSSLENSSSSDSFQDALDHKVSDPEMHEMSQANGSE